MSLIVYFCALFLINTIHATNSTNFRVTHSIAIDSSKYYTTTSIPKEYNTIYEIYIEYEYTTPRQPNISSHDLTNIFATSTSKTFKQFNLQIYDTTYCVVFTQYYNQTGLCSYYQYQGDIDTYIAYGTFISKPQLLTDYAAFTVYLSKYLTNSVGVGSFTIIDVDISPILITNKSPAKTNIFPFYFIDISVYVFLYVFVSLCLLIMCISKLFSVQQQHDAVGFLYFLNFIVFSLNFFANCIIFILRNFEQQNYMLGTFCVLLSILRLKFDVATALKSKSIWLNSAFIKKRVNSWYERYENVFIALSIICGPVGCVSFTNSRLFIMGIFCMDIPRSMVTHFIGNLFWKMLLFQRIPEFGAQIVFFLMNGYDNYWLFAVITSVFCMCLCVWYRLELLDLNLPELDSGKQGIGCSFLMEISSAEINNNSYKYLLQPTAFIEGICSVLDINDKCIELTSFEAINVSTETNYHLNMSQNKIFKCYGLKMYISVNTTSMLRRAILMKLQEAQQNGVLNKTIRAVWNLSEDVSIDDIVMVYSLSGDLVIQRAYSWEDTMGSQAKNLRAIEARNNEYIANQNELIEIIQKELINMDTGIDDYDGDEDLEVMFIDETSNDSNETSTSGGSGDSVEENKIVDIYLNDIDIRYNNNYNKNNRNRRVPSKIHIPDQSLLSLDINYDEVMNESLAIQLHRVASDSSVKTLVSL